METRAAVDANIPGSPWRETLHSIFGVDLRALAALRIGTGLLVLIDLFERARDVGAFYSDLGTLPRTLLIERGAENPWCFSFHLLSGQPAIQLLLFAIAAVFAIALTLGFHTKIATAVSWVLLVSLQYRNPIILQGGDVLLRLLLFWGLFLPWGNRFAADRDPRFRTAVARPFLSIATLALLLQICFVYWFAARLKSDPSWTRDFTAIYDAFSLDHFAKPLGKILLPYHRILRALTATSYWIEVIGPVVALLGGLVSWRLRAATVFLFIGFHAVMAACLELGLFPAICWVAWLAFLPSPFWSWCEKRLSPLFSNIQCGADRILHARWPPKSDRPLAAQSRGIHQARPDEYPAAANAFQDIGVSNNPSWFSSVEGGCVSGGAPTSAGTRSAPSASIHASDAIGITERKAPVEIWRTTGEGGRFAQSSPEDAAGADRSVRAHPFFPAAHSSVPSLLLRSAEPIHPIAASSRAWEVVRKWTANTLAALFLLYVLLWNLRTTNFARFAPLLPPSSDPIAWLSGTAQVWDMFSPGPLMEGGWFVMPARLANGKDVDIFRAGAPISWDKPALVSRMYPNDRWRKYMVLIAAASNAPLRPALAAYLFRNWNSTHSRQRRIVSLEIILMEQDTLPEKGFSSPRPIRLWSGNWNP
jgi:hypothetical protein